jgi:hypothetical protein
VAKDTQGRVRKQLYKAKGLSRDNRHRDSLYKGQLTLSRKAGIVTAYKKNQLTLSQDKMKKGDGVANDEDDDAVRTKVL